jgi:threonine dehydrogenase-like Zn-dependent dehydrogenase
MRGYIKVIYSNSQRKIFYIHILGTCAVPAEVDPHHAAFIEPLACSLHAVELGNIQGLHN